MTKTNVILTAAAGEALSKVAVAVENRGKQAEVVHAKMMVKAAAAAAAAAAVNAAVAVKPAKAAANAAAIAAAAAAVAAATTNGSRPQAF